MRERSRNAECNNKNNGCFCFHDILKLGNTFLQHCSIAMQGKQQSRPVTMMH